MTFRKSDVQNKLFLKKAEKVDERVEFVSRGGHPA